MAKDKESNPSIFSLKKKIKLILPFIMGFLVYLTLVLQDILPNFNILSLLLILSFILYIQKIDLFNRKYCKVSFFLSLFFSIITLIGTLCSNQRWLQTTNIWAEAINIRSILSLPGFIALYYSLFIKILPSISEIKITNDHEIKIKKHIFLYSAIIIFICYLPYFIINFPGFFSNDSIVELSAIANNLAGLSDHHPVIHILSAYFPYKLGMLIFNNATIAASLVILSQMIIMALIFASAIKFLAERNVKKSVLLIVLGIFALCPLHAFYSITMWKDIIFSGCILLLSMELYKLLEKRQITFKNSYSFIIVSIFTIFFRNNAIYMYIILSIVTIILFRKQLKVIVPMLLIVFATYFLVKGPIYNYFDIKTSSSAEYLAIPLQQIGRMAYKDVKFTKEEETLINDLIPINILKEVYNPEIVDSIKFNENYKSSAFEKNKSKYLKMWAGLCIKHFDIATEAYLIQTLGYYYPNVDYWTVLPQIDNNSLGIEGGKLSIRFQKITELLISKKIPIYNFIWSIGLCVWILFIAIILIFLSKNRKVLYTYVPVIGVWITMMVATPVYAEFRYVYSLFTSAPILLLIPYLKLEHKQ